MDKPNIIIKNIKLNVSKEELDLIADAINSYVEEMETSNDELQHRGALAKKYFDEVIRVYFEDPTKYFINWLNNENQ